VIKKRDEAAALATAEGCREAATGISLADLFRREKDLASFRRALLDLHGVFPFSCADMIDLGRAYFERFPDREADRNIDEVRLGYAVVRAAITEKVVLAVDASRRNAYRAIFDDAASVGAATEALIEAASLEIVLADHDAIVSDLAALKATIDGIPKGMIKERFIGGISYFFNVLFALKLSLRSRAPR
jgi:hypothetical protein